jgi:hypothetical protein
MNKDSVQELLRKGLHNALIRGAIISALKLVESSEQVTVEDHRRNDGMAKSDILNLYQRRLARLLKVKGKPPEGYEATIDSLTTATVSKLWLVLVWPGSDRRVAISIFVDQDDRPIGCFLGNDARYTRIG